MAKALCWKLLFATVSIALLPHVLHYWQIRGPSYWLVEIALDVAIPLALLYWLFKQGVHAADIGLSNPRHTYASTVIIARTLFATVAYLGYIVIYAIAAQYFEADQAAANDSGPDLRVMGIFAIMYYAVSAAFVEEVLFRGVLGVIILRAESLAAQISFILASAILFMASHPQSAYLPNAICFFYLGVAGAMLYIRFRNLWPLIFAHFVTNYVVLYFAAQES